MNNYEWTGGPAKGDYERALAMTTDREKVKPWKKLFSVLYGMNNGLSWPA
jgi:hypothetical protein